MSLVGVDHETIAQEYALTEIGQAVWVDVIIDELVKVPAINGDRQLAVNMASAKAASMLSTMKMIEERFGTAAGYFQTECGFSESDIATIRKHLSLS